MRIILSFIFICLSYITSSGYDSLRTNSLQVNHTSEEGYKFSYGIFFNDDSDFKNLFNESNLNYNSGSKIDYFSIAFYGKYPNINNLNIGFELYLLNGNGIAKNDTLEIKYPSDFFGFLIYSSYMIEFHRDIVINPFCKFGFGWGGISINFKNNQEEIKFKDIFKKNLIPKESINGIAGVLFPGISVEYLLISKNPNSLYGGVYLGFDIGYLTNLNNWKYLGYKVTGMPGVSYKGFLLSLSLISRY